jgi:hypothetical protein
VFINAAVGLLATAIVYLIGCVFDINDGNTVRVMKICRRGIDAVLQTDDLCTFREFLLQGK